MVYSNCQCSFTFCWSLTLFRTALWAVGICWERSVPFAFHLCCFIFSAALVVRVPFPFWCFGQDVEFDCIGSWSLHFYLLFVNAIIKTEYFTVGMNFIFVGFIDV